MADPDGSGTLQVIDGRLSIRFERRLAQGSERVWRAITDSGDLARWFPADIEGRRAPEAPIRIVSWTERFPRAHGRFIVYEPPRRLEYTWGDELLRWELRDESAGCVLTFTNVLDAAAAEVGPAAIAAAWHGCLDVLEFVLADRPPPYSVDDRAGELMPTYAERFDER